MTYEFYLNACEQCCVMTNTFCFLLTRLFYFLLFCIIKQNFIPKRTILYTGSIYKVTARITKNENYNQNTKECVSLRPKT